MESNSTNVEDIKAFTIRGDGGTIPVTADRLTWFKTEFMHITMHAGWSVNDRRLLAEDTRFCRWPGQSTDGKKHADANNGKPAFPFEGASDVRMRTADEIINEQVILLMAAAMKMQLSFTSPDPAKADLGDKLAVLWEWVKHNQLRREWFFELRRLAQFRQGDSPANGFLQVDWYEESTLQMLTVTAEEAVEKILEDAQERGDKVTQEVEQKLAAAFRDPTEQPLLALIIQAHWPEMPASRAKDVAAQMLNEGSADFPYPVAKPGRVRFQARRLMEDIYVPENTGRLQHARGIWIREWFTLTELRERESKGEFLPGFVDQVLKHEGETCWRHFTHWHINGDYSNRIVERTWDKERHRGQYEIMTCFFKAANTRTGIPGIYYVKYHFAVDKPGSDMELCDYKHGQYPFLEFPREVLTGKVWDTRGISELSMTDQQSLKILHDSFMDHTQLVTVPPIKVPSSRPKLQLVLGPMKLIKEQRPGEISWMIPPEYPKTNGEADARTQVRLDRYFGRMSKNNTEDYIRAYQQDLIDFFLYDLVEGIRQSLSLLQQYMTDDMVARVLGPDSVPIARKVEDIQGEFDVEVTFEAGMLSLAWLEQVAKIINDYAFQWDQAGQIRRGEVEKWLFGGISPNLARRFLQPIEVANQKEAEAALTDFGKIKDGIEPERPTQGVDFQTRLQTILNVGKMNPEAFSTLAPVSRQILQDHLQYLEGQISQQKNAVIGREMAPRTLPIGGASAAEAALPAQ
jgi:hypothetical protein